MRPSASAAVSLIYGTLWVIFRRQKRSLCVNLGGFAGALGGFVAQFQKISTSVTDDGALVTGSASGLEGLLNPFTLFWILLSISSMTVLQLPTEAAGPLE